MSHSHMLKNRRKKQTAKKDLAGMAKRAKKLKKESVKTVSAKSKKKSSA